MAEIQDHIKVNTELKDNFVEPEAFNINNLISSDERIPTDLRAILVGKNDYASTLGTDGTGQFLTAYSEKFFTQEKTPDELMLSRYIKTNSSPFFAWGSGYTADYLLWKNINDGEILFEDSEANTVTITAIDFSAVTSFDQVLTLLNNKLSALVAPAIVGLELAEFVEDGVGRIILKLATTGATAITVEIKAIASPTGTDISTEMDLDNSKTVAGFDAETPEEAVDAISEVNDTYFNIHFPELTKAENISMAGKVETLKKTFDIVTSEAGVKDPSITNDICSTLQALGYDNTMVIYHENPSSYPQASEASRLMSEKEGKVNYAWMKLIGAEASGVNAPLSKTARKTIVAKGGNYIQNIKKVVTLYDGQVVNGREKRLIVGREWFNTRIEEARFDAQINDDLQAFDNETLAGAEADILEVAEEAIERKILDNTEERPFTTNFPNADDIPASVRATRKYIVEDAYHGYMKSAINDWEINGSWQL